jgi:hypothetical protein
VRSIAEKRFAALKYRPPEDLVREVETEVRQLAQPKPGAKTSSRKKTIEQYQAGSMALLIAKMAGPFAVVDMAMYEDEDYDGIIRIQVDLDEAQRPTAHPSAGKHVRFRQVQLKELVPHSMNGNTSLQNEIGKLEKYPASPDLLVSIAINRDMQFTLSDIDTTRLKIGELYLWGDSHDGAVELHGGRIEDWRAGIVWHGRMVDLSMTTRTIRFVPYSSVH